MNNQPIAAPVKVVESVEGNVTKYYKYDLIDDGNEFICCMFEKEKAYALAETLNNQAKMVATLGGALREVLDELKELKLLATDGASAVPAISVMAIIEPLLTSLKKEMKDES